MALSWKKGDMDSAQQLYYQYAKQFDKRYTPLNSFPPQNIEGTDRGITYFHKVFNPEQVVTFTLVHEDENETIPLFTRTFGVYKSQIVLYMGLISMKNVLKGAPLKDSMKTTNYSDRISNMINTMKEAERSIKQKVEKPDWNGINPNHRGMPWPREFKDYEAELWEIEEFVRQRYPQYYKALDSQKLWDKYRMSPKKLRALENLQELEKRYFKGKPISEIAYTEEYAPTMDVRFKLAHAVNEKVEESLKKLGFKEIPKTEEEMVILENMYEKDAPIFKEVLELVSENPAPKALLYLDNQVKKSWWGVIKVFDRGDSEDEDDDEEEDPDNIIHRNPPKWARVIRGTGGRFKHPVKDFYGGRMKGNQNQPCVEEIKSILIKYIIYASGEWLEESDDEIKRIVRALTPEQIDGYMESDSFELVSTTFEPKENKFGDPPDEFDQEFRQMIKMKENTLYELWQNCNKMVQSWTEELKPDTTLDTSATLPDADELSRNEMLRERMRDLREKQTGERQERWGDWQEDDEDEF